MFFSCILGLSFSSRGPIHRHSGWSLWQTSSYPDLHNVYDVIPLLNHRYGYMPVRRLLHDVHLANAQYPFSPFALSYVTFVSTHALSLPGPRLFSNSPLTTLQQGAVTETDNSRHLTTSVSAIHNHTTLARTTCCGGRRSDDNHSSQRSTWY